MPDQVFVAVRHDDGVAAHDDAGVDGALGGHVTPDFLAGLCLDGVNATIAESDNQQSGAVDRGDQGRRIGGVVRPSSRIRHVDDLAGSLVERDDAMRARCLRAPVRHRRADDDQIAIDDGRHRPASVRGEGREFFTDRSLPERLAVGAQRDERRADIQRVDVAGFGISGWRGPAHAMGGHIALKDVELVFPDDLARVGVERHDTFLQRRPATRRVLYVDAISHDDRRRSAAKRRAPQQICALQIP